MLQLWRGGKGEGGKDGRMVGDAELGFPSLWNMQMRQGFGLRTFASRTAREGALLLSLLTSWLSQDDSELLSLKKHRGRT